MQIIIKGPITFHDKDIISLSESQRSLEVAIGEDPHALMRVIFADTISYIRTTENNVQGLIEETEMSEFMEESLTERYDPGPLVKEEKYPSDHGYKRYVFYSHQDMNEQYRNPALEVVAKKNVTVELI